MSAEIFKEKSCAVLRCTAFLQIFIYREKSSRLSVMKSYLYTALKMAINSGFIILLFFIIIHFSATIILMEYKERTNIIIDFDYIP